MPADVPSPPCDGAAPETLPAATPEGGGLVDDAVPPGEVVVPLLGPPVPDALPGEVVLAVAGSVDAGAALIASGPLVPTALGLDAVVIAGFVVVVATGGFTIASTLAVLWFMVAVPWFAVACVVAGGSTVLIAVVSVLPWVAVVSAVVFEVA
jgi:hypothetical protein